MSTKKTIRRAFNFLVLGIAIISFLSTQTSCTNSTQNDKNKVVTVSIPPIKYLVDRISGNELAVNVMVSTGACQETYEPTPSQMKDVAQSELYFGIKPLEFEMKWIDNIKKNNQKLRYINLAEGMACEEATCNHEAGHDDHGHNHEGVDPHLWLSPTNYGKMAQKVLDALLAYNPKSKEKYVANFTKLQQEIDSIDKDARTKLLGLKNKQFVIYHPALTYFANDYNLKQTAIEQNGKEPAADYLKRIVKESKANGIKTIFVQKEFDLSLIKSFAIEVGASIEPINTFAYNWTESTSQIVNALYTANHE